MLSCHLGYRGYSRYSQWRHGRRRGLRGRDHIARRADQTRKQQVLFRPFRLKNIYGNMTIKHILVIVGLKITCFMGLAAKIREADFEHIIMMPRSVFRGRIVSPCLRISWNNIPFTFFTPAEANRAGWNGNLPVSSSKQTVFHSGLFFSLRLALENRRRAPCVLAHSGRHVFQV
jgi:hypothetical protein